MKKLLLRFENLGMKSRLLLVFGTVLLVTMAATTLSIHSYSQRFIRKLLEQNSIQKMKELNQELNALYDRVNQIFITLNSGKFYEIFESTLGLSDFERMKETLSYEKEIKEIINGNNMQSAILGNIFFISEQNKVYVGSGTMSKNFQVKDSEWFQQFCDQGSKKLIYGPVVEEFRPANSISNQALYYLRAWNVPFGSEVLGDQVPFILFSINMQYIDQIFESYTESYKGYIVTDEAGNVLHTWNLREKEAITSMIKEQSSDFLSNDTYMNREWFVSRVEENKLGWNIYSVESTQEMFREMNSVIRNVNLIILVTGMVAFGLTIVLSSKIMMPIRILNQLISTIEEENDTFITVRSNDEIGQIGNRFNQMKRKLQDMSANIYLSKVQEKEAQLSALQSQINPHFLYNTLDNIYCIAQIEDVDAIIHLSEDLSNMMRYSMDMKRRSVPLLMELAHVQAYVNIINIRFDDGIQLDLSIPESLSHIMILKLTLQPLVENAWNHGLLLKPEHKGTIHIQFEQEEENLLVTVSDDGIGITKERSEEMNDMLKDIDYETTQSAKGFGVALKNVNNRIKLSDGLEYGITLWPNEDGGCKAQMRMKLQWEK